MGIKKSPDKKKKKRPKKKRKLLSNASSDANKAKVCFAIFSLLRR